MRRRLRLVVWRRIVRAVRSDKITMRDRLSHLSFTEAARMLGRDGRRLLVRGGALELPSSDALRIDDVSARVDWADGASAALVCDPMMRGGLRIACTICRGGACIHTGGLLSLVLEHKSDLALAVPPDTVFAAGEKDLVQQALREREERAAKERMTIASAQPDAPWTDYRVTSALSGKTYRVALRGAERGISYCSCPDFKVSTLGTCKHVMKVLARATKRFSVAVRARPYRRKRITIHVRYDEQPSLAIALPQKLDDGARRVLERVPRGESGDLDATALVAALGRLDAGGHAFFVTPDAEELLDRRLVAARLSALVREVRAAPSRHPLRRTLLREPLLPYQLDGIAFAAGAGRAILADEMGLGKTIQGVGVAELLAREVGIAKVLVICPASLKSQWRSEIARFSNRSAALVTGASDERVRAYAADSFFTICNYEQVLRDITYIEKTRWDLVILDEGQRIKNWEAKTSRVVKGLSSRFALVLSGTPLENRLDDLHSVVAFVDPHRLGPLFKFQHRHQKRDVDGKLLAVRNLDELRARLAPLLLRRTRDSVRLELPERTIETVRVKPTEEQMALHDAHMRIVASIVRKKFFSEMDLLRLRQALLMCRMAADSTYLVDKEPPGSSSKLERLGEIFDAIAGERDRKVIVFSEWTTMLDLLEPLLEERRLRFVRLDGSVAQKKRQELVATFQTDPKTRFFLATNAGSTGLNLQAANTVVNVDLPWNPAVLEQRIARAHRMGQTRPVHAIVLVSEGTIEDSLLATLSTKRDLALAALDPSSDVSEVEVRSQGEDLKKKLEVLLGKKPDAPIDDIAVASSSRAIELGRAGATFVDAAFALLAAASGAKVDALRAALDPKLIFDDQGSPRVSFAIPPREVVANVLRSFADVLAAGAAPTPPPMTKGSVAEQPN